MFFFISKSKCMFVEVMVFLDQPANICLIFLLIY